MRARLLVAGAVAGLLMGSLVWGADNGPGAYPSMVELDDGRILCLYYRELNKGAGSSIRQAIFRVKLRPTLEFVDQ